MQHSDLIKQICLIELAFKKIDHEIPLELSEAHKLRQKWDKEGLKVTTIDPLKWDYSLEITTTFVKHAWSDRFHLATDFQTAYASLQGYFDASVMENIVKNPT